MLNNEPDFRTEPAGNGLNKIYINGIKQPGRYTILEAAEICDKLREEQQNADD